MNALPQALEQYLSTRQALGFKLRGYRSRLSDFVAYVDQVGETTITSEVALGLGHQAPERPSLHVDRSALHGRRFRALLEDAGSSLRSTIR